ncbi:PREDICTED: serine/threonine-protein phosphatase PGAM5, mitochondrial [Atta cephalotes]|uniref:Serine/threonine-protein phosphatase PGAM5, mitochondrial n=2 Tax=Atta TaxID=12956 RepID=A0A158N9I5_ATTCE|nr:PREDICTED: serine/threonine-protein phosphatase PGAM5, mitochondrial [Atta cephalotes]XP_018046270.1 PREDICTED: serine/threonine-protein phosphatase PGAM5, mitochondrial [Atta colombica]KYM84707.1 Serine/threonine-protein phosphatase Pgam5, mitochondrial [Atta colombica]
MPTVSQLHKWALGLGAVSGTILYYYNAYSKTEPLRVHNSWTTNYTPSVKWDHNWDRRDPQSLVKPMKVNDENDENKYNEKFEAKKAKAVRHILLIRHGQYHTDGKTDIERMLTELGRKQAEATGKRLAELNLPYSLIVRSTMTRALETSQIIEKNLIDVPVETDSLLVEGAPIPPEPPIGQWKSERHFFQDGPRIEAAFRKYFHRAEPNQDRDSYTVLVCHANVIRYFVCRALQFPPEAWLRICLKHGSITWLCILPSGRVTLYCLGDTGHMLPQNVTSS